MKKLLFAIATLTAGYGFSQNLMGAYISTAQYDGEDTYQAVVKLDLMMSPWATPAASVAVDFGDGTSGGLGLDSSKATTWTTHHYYSSGYHEYPVADANYTITYQGSGRVAGIRNMQNSENQPLEVQTMIHISNQPANYFGMPLADPENCFLSGSNQFTYNPQPGYYPGGLTYSLVNCAGAGYYIPAGTTLNDTSGLLSLHNDTAAVYAVSVVIKKMQYNGPSVPAAPLLSTFQMDFLVGMNGTTGIDQYVSEIMDANLYPNPFQNKLQLECRSCSNALHKITVRNNLGQVVAEVSNPSSQQALDLEALPAGIYLVELQDQAGHKTNSKVVKEL